MCASSSWDFWKTPEISFSLTAVPTLQPVFMYLNRGGSRILVTGVQSVLIQAIFWGIYPRIPNSHSRKTPKTHTKMKNASNLPPPPQICGFPQSTKSRINTIGPISEGETRIEGGKRARIDGEVQEKAGSPSPENF